MAGWVQARGQLKVLVTQTNTRGDKMNWAQDEVREINSQDWHDLFELFRDDIVYATFQVRFQQLLLGKLTVMNGEDNISDFGLDVVRTLWVPFIHQMAVYFCLFGFCPYVIVKKKMLVTDADKVRESQYGETYDPKVQYVDVEVPCVPVRGTYRIQQRIVKREQVLVVVDNDGTPAKDIHVVRSTMCPLPDWLSGKFQSEGAVLLDEWRRIRQFRSLRHHVDVFNSLPPIIIQRQIRNDMQAFTELQASHIAHFGGNIRVSPNGFIEMNSGKETIAEETALGDLYHGVIQNGQCVNRSQLTHRIPDGFEYVSQVPLAHLEGRMEDMMRRFEERVCAVLRVPHEYMYGSRSGGGSGKGGPLIQNVTSADNARIRLINNVSLNRSDLATGLKDVWLAIYGEEDRAVHFHIPLPTTVELSSILDLIEYDALPDKVAMEEILGILNIEHKRVDEHLDLNSHRLKRLRPGNSQTGGE